jgi:hypothetical protein
MFIKIKLCLTGTSQIDNLFIESINLIAGLVSFFVVNLLNFF